MDTNIWEEQWEMKCQPLKCSNQVTHSISCQRMVDQIHVLSEIAKNQPQCAHSGFVGGFVSKFS